MPSCTSCSCCTLVLLLLPHAYGSLSDALTISMVPYSSTQQCVRRLLFDWCESSRAKGLPLRASSTAVLHASHEQSANNIDRTITFWLW
jgi:hypothetical protein